MSCILDDKAVRKLIHRYDGLGKPLTSDDRELLLFALYCESEHSGGSVKLARDEEDRLVAARAALEEKWR